MVRWPPSSTAPSLPDVLARLTTLLVAALTVAACAGPEASTEPPASSASASAPVSSAPAPDESAAAEPSALVSIEAPGQPYDAEDILVLMRDSRRPGGVPDEIETEAVAAAVAEQIWTIGGRPWAVASIGGDCGPSSCNLEVAGASAADVGEDVYVFRVDPATGSVELEQSVLLGLEPEIVEELDRLVRERYEGDLDDLLLTTARWLPPPDDGRFVLAYRSGGEEGSPGIDLVFDATTGEVSEVPAS